jgi:uncharacterized protein
MVIHDLTRPECEALLTRSSLGRLACSRAGQPYIVPISFSFDPEACYLYSFSTLGQKIQWMRLNPRVCVEVEEIVDRYHWTTVLVIGRYEEIGDAELSAAARQRAQLLFQQRDSWWLPGAGKVAGREEHGNPVVFRIHIDKISGRQADRAS